uniref:Uncharacterized protein n=1 Tax=Chlorocebus sabaeus TaxID=60711 RepID=A0A0D9R147_CHLSB
MCWGYRGSEHLPHTGRTLAPMFTMLRETFGEQREASRGMGPHLSSIRGRARACPTSLLALPGQQLPGSWNWKASQSPRSPTALPTLGGGHWGDRARAGRKTGPGSPRSSAHEGTRSRAGRSGPLHTQPC